MGVHSIPKFIKKSVDSDVKPFMVAYHYKQDPDVVRSWDNESIARAYYALVKMGVLK